MKVIVSWFHNPAGQGLKFRNGVASISRMPTSLEEIEELERLLEKEQGTEGLRLVAISPIMQGGEDGSCCVRLLE